MGLRAPVQAAIIALVLALTATAGRGHDFGDDYGDSSTNAHALVPGTNCPGKTEIDTDEDWFSFQVSPLKQYVVTVTTGAIWDTSIELKVSDGVTTRGATNSVLTSPSQISCIHYAPPATCYVRVKGFAEFTTGTYSVVVSETNFTDLDGDGMEDGWEVFWFTSTNQSPSADWDEDGSSNLEEFRLGTSPKDPLSGLRISSLQYGTQSVSVTGSVQPYRCYALSVRTNLTLGGWQKVQTVTNSQVSGSMIFYDTNTSGSTRFYRLECLF